MDNYPSSPSDYAALTLRLMNGEKLQETQVKSLAKFLGGSHPGNISEQVAGYLMRPEAMLIWREKFSTVYSILDGWKTRYEHQGSLSNDQALEFFRELTRHADLMDEFVGQRVLVGVSKAERDTVSDVSIHRTPGSVKGWVLELTVDGEGQYNCLRGAFNTKVGDIVLLSPDALYDHQRSANSHVWSHYWFYFYPDVRLSEWLQWPEIGPGVSRLSLTDRHLQRVKQVFEQAFDQTSLSQKQLEPLLMNLVEQVLIRCSDDLSDKVRDKLDPRVQAAQALILERLEAPLTVSDIAQQAELSKTQLSTLFKQYHGCTLMTWREERRMARASQLLAQSSDQIQEIARRVGYDDPLYFSRVFSRLVGCSPRQYRQLLQEGEGRTGS